MSSPSDNALGLPAGTVLKDYEIHRILGKGGFAITYLAKDLQLNSLVVLKELLPDGIATRINGNAVVTQSPALNDDFQWAVSSFLQEARTLATFDHPNIVRISRLFEANGTAYFSGAVANYGPDDAVFAADSVVMRVDFDSSSLITITGPTGQPYTLEAGTYAYFEDLEVGTISPGSHISTLIADPDGLLAESDEGDNTWDYYGDWSAKASTSTTPVNVPEARIHVAPIPGWEAGRTLLKQRPLSFNWTGSAPLTPGRFQIDNSKATTVDMATYIPAAAHVSGALGTNWRTDVELHNPGATQARVEVAMLERNRANATPETRTFYVAAGTSKRLEDILYTSFTFDGAAALRITTLEGLERNRHTLFDLGSGVIERHNARARNHLAITR